MRHELPILAAAALGATLAWPRLPTARGVETPGREFSAARALTHVAAWSTAPRPVGSVRHDEVVQLLATELESQGFVVERQRPGDLQNLVASAPGAAQDGVWLVAHSDSVAEGPGAADDGLGLGVITEVSRALSLDGVPVRLHVLFTDGEEAGLRGAEAFVRTAPAAERLAINIDARGDQGPAYMFQVAGPSSAMLDGWQASGCTAQATSLARTVYDLLPNDTDFTVLQRAGWNGYNLALIGGAHRYHSAEDTVANLDPRSVQHVGDCVLALARTWLDRTPTADARSFAYAQAGPWTWVLPTWVIRALGVVVLATSRSRPSLRGAAIGASIALATLVAGVLLQGVAVALWPGFTAPVAEIPNAWRLIVPAFGIGVVGCVAWRRWAGGEVVDSFTVAFGGLAAMGMPTAGYLLLPGAAVSAVRSRHAVFALLPAFLAGITLGPFYAGIGEALTSRMLPLLAVLPVMTVGWVFGGAGRSPRVGVTPAAG